MFLVRPEMPVPRPGPAIQDHRSARSRSKRRSRDRSHAQLFRLRKSEHGEDPPLTGEDAEIGLDAVGAFFLPSSPACGGPFMSRRFAPSDSPFLARRIVTRRAATAACRRGEAQPNRAWSGSAGRARVACPQEGPGNYRNPYRNLHIGLRTKVLAPQIPKCSRPAYQSARG